MRTTTAPTVIRGGDKDNVLPAKATVIVSFRLLPGNSVGTVTQRVKEIVNDLQIQVRTLG